MGAPEGGLRLDQLEPSLGRIDTALDGADLRPHLAQHLQESQGLLPVRGVVLRRQGVERIQRQPVRLHLVEEATQFGVMRIDPTRRVTGFLEKPKNPEPMPGETGRCLANMGVYVFDANFLFEELCRDATVQNSSARERSHQASGSTPATTSTGAPCTGVLKSNSSTPAQNDTRNSASSACTIEGIAQASASAPADHTRNAVG